MPEGKPTAKPLDEDAAHFLVRMVRKFPHEVTIYAGGPMTNLALAISIDPEFPQLAKELVFMGASLNPQTTDPEFINTPAARIQHLVRSRSGPHCVARAVEKDDLHDGGHLGEDQNDSRPDQPDQSQQARRRRSMSANIPACLANTTICGMNWRRRHGLIPA